MFTRLRAHLPLWRRALRRRRRLLTVLVLTAAFAAVLPPLLPPTSRSAEVLVAGAVLEPGTVLGPEDLRPVRIGADLVPQGAAQEPGDVVGRTVRLRVEPGTPLLPGLLEDPALPAAPSGSALMAVPVPEALAGHLHPGAELMLLLSEPSQASGSAVHAQVIELMPPGSTSGALGEPPSRDAEVLVAVETSRAGEVAHAQGQGAVTVSVISP